MRSLKGPIPCLYLLRRGTKNAKPEKVQCPLTMVDIVVGNFCDGCVRNGSRNLGNCKDLESELDYLGGCCEHCWYNIFKKQEGRVGCSGDHNM